MYNPKEISRYFQRVDALGITEAERLTCLLSENDDQSFIQDIADMEYDSDVLDELLYRIGELSRSGKVSATEARSFETIIRKKLREAKRKELCNLLKNILL